MGKQWKAAGKAENNAKKGKIFTKLAREVMVASKMGGPDPSANSRLRMAIDAARKGSCPKDTIDRAIKKGAGQLDDDTQIDEVTYEGYGPHGVGVIVECQTDNRHRTAPEVKNTFKKHGGSIGEIGSVTWMFDRVALVEAEPAEAGIDPEEEAIEAGAADVDENDDGGFTFWGAPEDTDKIQSALTERGWTVAKAEMAYKPNNPADLSEEQKAEVGELLSALDDLDDSHRVYASVEY